MLLEYVVEKSSPLSLELRNCHFYNFYHTQDCLTNVAQLPRSIFSLVSQNGNQSSFIILSEHADRFLHETFEIFFSCSQYNYIY